MRFGWYYSSGGLPALEELELSNNCRLGDGAIVALAEALLEATQTRLRILNMFAVGMGDAGAIALASVVDQGRLDEVEVFNVAKYRVSNEGLTALARAIDARGLPMLNTFVLEGLGRRGIVNITAMMDALIRSCPKLTTIVWESEIPAENDIVTCMLQAAERVEVDVISHEEYEQYEFD